jgi:hypothetical protein
VLVSTSSLIGDELRALKDYLPATGDAISNASDIGFEAQSGSCLRQLNGIGRSACEGPEQSLSIELAAWFDGRAAGRVSRMEEFPL